MTKEPMGPPCPKCGRPTVIIAEYNGIGRPVLKCTGCMRPVEDCTCVPVIRMPAKEPVETPAGPQQ